jgi:hypothetical protein
LHPESDDIALAERQTLYGTGDTAGGD